jgi:putative transposase
MHTTVSRNCYDYRIRNAVVATGDPRLFSALDINRSTARSWLRRGHRDVVTADIVERTEVELLEVVAKKDRTIALLRGVLCLLLALIRVTRARLDNHQRLPDGSDKSSLLHAVDRARSLGLSLQAALRLLGLSPPRYHAWKNALPACELTDRSSCPRNSPGQLTPDEIATIKQIVTDKKYRHIPTNVLAVLAQRARLVSASAATWYRLIKERNWIRPRSRIHPPSPSIGVRAPAPNIFWHIDTTVIKLLDGTRLFLHAVIDNYSRKILSWSLTNRLSPLTTCEILSRAAAFLDRSCSTSLVADSGFENTANAVDDFFSIHQNIKRVLAQVEVSFSNSMIEAFWRSLKHNWLFLNTLDSFGAVLKLVTFYIAQHNTVIPHSAFQGQTPDEIFFCTGDHIPQELAAFRSEALRKRRQYNLSLSCQQCLQANPPADTESSSPPSAIAYGMLDPFP